MRTHSASPFPRLSHVTDGIVEFVEYGRGRTALRLPKKSNSWNTAEDARRSAFLRINQLAVIANCSWSVRRVASHSTLGSDLDVQGPTAEDVRYPASHRRPRMHDAPAPSRNPTATAQCSTVESLFMNPISGLRALLSHTYLEILYMRACCGTER